jgi:ABC-type methionine transport system permease subunit
MRVILGALFVFIVLFIWRPKIVTTTENRNENLEMEINWSRFIPWWIFYSLLAAIIAVTILGSSTEKYTYFTEN